MRTLLKQLLEELLWRRVAEQVALHRPRVVAVTGSVGKTSTKDAIARVLLESDRPVLKSEGNMGTEIGLPLTLLGFSDLPASLLDWLQVAWRAATYKPKPLAGTGQPYYVLEYAADKPGDIGYLAGRIKPDVAVLTKIVPVHMQAYESLDALVAEKRSLLKSLSKGGYAVLNADDPAQNGVPGESIRYGFAEPGVRSDGVWAHSVKVEGNGLACTLEYRVTRKLDGIASQKSQRLTLTTQVLGKQQLAALLAAAAVGFREGVQGERIAAALSAYQLPNGRGRRLEGKKEMQVIDDTYNASPDAVKAGLDMLRPLAGKRRVVAVLGNMNELGAHAEVAHREVAAYAATRVDYLVAVGPYREEMLQAAGAAGMPKVHLIGFATPEQLLQNVEQVTRAHDLVYVKGSQNGVRLERFVKLLMAHPEEADRNLVRQERFWKKR